MRRLLCKYGFSEVKDKLFNLGLIHAINHGFNTKALQQACLDLNLSSTSSTIIKPIDLIHHSMRKWNREIIDTMTFDENFKQFTINNKIKNLIKSRLQLQEPYMNRWNEAMAQGAQHANVTSSILWQFADDCWYLAGDKSSDINHYTKRIMFLYIYISTELFMLTDKSPQFFMTWDFLDRFWKSSRFSSYNSQKPLKLRILHDNYILQFPKIKMNIMNKTLQLLYSPEIYDKIHNSNILIIGVGGIGCELLKVLTNSGYRKMTILDLDTIEATNLNRQFYFRKEHVGMSKSLVGKESVMKKHPELDITAIHGSIFEGTQYKQIDKFDVEFYQQFDLVFCALDNNLAREHLGRMCIKSNRIMVDAGTGGFSGQSNVVKRFLHQCNNCQPSKGAPSFAVCTIRASPSQPIHCVTYAMALYNLLFGQLDESNVLAGLLDLAQIQSCDKSDDNLLRELAISTFDKLFYEQIKQGLAEYSKPEDSMAINQFKYPISYQQGIQIEEVYTNEDQSKQEEENDKLQPFKYYVQLFVDQFVQIMKTPGVGSFKFDKDDWDSVKFATAVTNMRTYNFTKKYKNVDPSLTQGDKLKFMSVNAVRQLGGKIIPAIASTNAIAAAIQVSESKKVLEEQWGRLRMNWIQPSFEKIAPTQLSEPFDTCQHCTTKNVYLHIYADFNTAKLSTVVELAKSFGVGDYDINCSGGTVYGKLNKQLNRTGLNDLNYDQPLVTFNEGKFSSMIFTIYAIPQGRQFFWNISTKYEFIMMHREGLQTPQISKQTKLEDALQQLKRLCIQKHEELAEKRISHLERYGY